jgi:gamma-glutamyltranspeptidase/glutathione hydrolase
MNRRDFVLSLGAAGMYGGVAHTDPQAQQVVPGVAGGDRVMPEARSVGGRPHALWARNGVVAADTALAAVAGNEMLVRGGNAIDAIAATAAALNVVEPQMGGMGGWGGYMVMYLAREKKIAVLDGMGSSPAAAAIGKITEAECDEGYKALVVPGGLGTWAEALSRYGTMSLGDVFEPAIDLAERGFRVTRLLAAAFESGFRKLGQFPASAAMFFPEGRPPREGELLKHPALARSFRRVALEGPGVFYTGEIGRQIVDAVQRGGGFLTMADMEAYKPRWRDPIQTTFQGHTLYGPPPGSCAMTMFQALNILDGFDLRNMDLWSADFAHHWLEAMKLAFADDDRYNTGKNVDIPVARLLSRGHADTQRARINSRHAMAFPGPTLPFVGTTSLAAADRFGNVVTFTQSHVSGFGSGVVAGDTGILLNNGHRFGFVLDPGHVNSLVGGQPAKGVMSPAIAMKDGKVVLAVGAAGGYTIPQTVGQTIVRVLAYGLDIQRAIASPRLMLNRAGGRVPIENDERTFADPGYPDAALAGLRTMGHTLTEPSNGGSSVQGVYIDADSGGMAAGFDPRRDGAAIGW